MHHRLALPSVSLHPFLWHMVLKSGKGSGEQNLTCVLWVELSPYLRQLSFPPVGLGGREDAG